IAMSSAAFSFSHSTEGRMGAAITGAYLGLLAHKNKGRLEQGISLHFWAVFILGIESAVLTFRAQNYGGQGAPTGIKLTIPFL
ncbi:MAG: hypothetical protein H7333_04450, partial [Bdellovibrionales bacterium]|nr:hypothetical protein [Oligoflexia bacterium]